MKKSRFYLEYKKCKKCGNDFSEKSLKGNPYKYCPSCRFEKWQKLLNFVKQGEKKK